MAPSTASMNLIRRLRPGLRLFVALCVLALLLASALGAWAWSRYRAFADQPLFAAAMTQTLAEHVVVERGDSFARVLGKLREAGVSHGQRWQWQWLARELDVAGRIQVGEYALSSELTPRELLARLRDGRVIAYRFTIIEGWNMRDLRAALSAARPLEQTMAGLDDAALMARLGRAGIHPEGRFLPETYLYVRGERDFDLLRRAADALDEALADAWAARAANLPLQTPEQALILASIIEKETGIGTERAQIAGVFARRLARGMRLQTDPTVIYGMGSAYNGNLRRIDLTTDTPWNTYTRAGLPPTPIAMPGRAALQAAVRPDDGDALYFVAVGDGSGRHVFSPTLAEHNRAVAAYVRRYRERYN